MSFPPQLLLGTPVGTTAGAPLGGASIVYPADADYTLTTSGAQPESTRQFLQVTSTPPLTATRKLVVPLNDGQPWIVQNSTTGGQSILVIGPSGTGVVVLNGAIASVVCDGTNIYPLGGQGGLISVANQAALEALPVAGLPTGTEIYLASQTTEWSYEPADTSAADYLHIPALGGGNFVYKNATNPFAWQGATFYVDPVGGSDDNPGTALLPWQTVMGGWVTRVGGIYGIIDLRARTILQMVNGETIGSELIQFAISMATPATRLSILGAYNNLGAATTIATRTAKNRSTGQRLVITATALPGGVAVGTLVLNTSTTPHSMATVEGVSGANLTLTQPTAVQTLGAPNLFPAEDDTWGVGNNIQFQTTLGINLGDISGLTSDSSAFVLLQALTFQDQTGSEYSYPGGFTGLSVLLVDCYAKNCQLLLSDTFGAFLTNVLSNYYTWVYNNYLPFFIAGSYLNLIVIASSPVVDGDTHVAVLNAEDAGGSTIYIGLCYAGQLLTQNSSVWVNPVVYGSAALWGGSSNMMFKSTLTLETGLTFSGVLLQTTYDLNSSNTVQAYNSGTGAWTHGVTCNPTNMDANGGLVAPVAQCSYALLGAPA